MANIMIYKAEYLTPDKYKIFAGVYNDFCNKAKTEYKFELEPLSCEEFLEAVDKELLQCIVLMEDDIPTAFLVYTTVISESIELNIIHCLGQENIVSKKKVLLEKFLELNQSELISMTTAYPMLGCQDDLVCDITQYGFKLIGITVLRFNYKDESSIEALNRIASEKIKYGYSIEKWADCHKSKICTIINESFKDSSDALFDPRFLTEEGCQDIVDKITNDTYGKFLPESTKILVYDKMPIGICFVNTTNNGIANIPIVCIKKEYRKKHLSESLVATAVNHTLNLTRSGELPLTEINVSTELDNIAAVKMYCRVGFKEDYYYPQAYLSPANYNGKATLS